jgi:hypothetical protein
MPDNTAPVLTENHIRRMVETSLEAVALCGASLLSDAFASVPSPSERGFLSSSPQAEPSVRISRTGVCTENLNPNVTVVKSAKNGVRFYDTAPLNWARDRRIFVQRPVRSYIVVIASIGSHDAAQMCLAQYDEMIHTLAPDQSNQPFGKAILPGRAWCSRLVPDAHRAQSACDDGAIDAIPIADQIGRRLIPRECLS